MDPENCKKPIDQVIVDIYFDPAVTTESDIKQHIKAFKIIATISKLDSKFIKNMTKRIPTVIVPIGDISKMFMLSKIPNECLQLWAPIESLSELTEELILQRHTYFTIYFDYYTTKLKQPLVSVFTAAYKSYDKLNRAYVSLQNQTWYNWEWVIVDDSDDIEHWEYLNNKFSGDHRVRLYKTDTHRGCIGSVKYDAAMLCRGKYLLEIDHDDELASECMYEVVQAFEAHPQCALVYTDFAEVYTDDYASKYYGDGWAFGYGTYISEMYRNYENKLIRVSKCNSVPVNIITTSNIVGVPNHLRAWRKSIYHRIGGHNTKLAVADDYELILRTILDSKGYFVHIPKLLYIQYMNGRSNNTTVQCNQLIQDTQKMVYRAYRSRLLDYFSKDLALYNNYKYKYCWEIDAKQYYDAHTNVCTWTNSMTGSIAIIIPVTEANHMDIVLELMNLLKKQSYQVYTLYLIGNRHEIDFHKYFSDKPEWYNNIALKWWTMPSSNAVYLANYICRCNTITEDLVTYVFDITWWLNQLHRNKDYLYRLMVRVVYKYTKNTFENVFARIIHADSIKSKPAIDTERLWYRNNLDFIHRRILFENHGFWNTTSSGSIKEKIDELISRDTIAVTFMYH